MAKIFQKWVNLDEFISIEGTAFGDQAEDRLDTTAAPGQYADAARWRNRRAGGVSQGPVVLGVPGAVGVLDQYHTVARAVCTATSRINDALLVYIATADWAA